MSDPFAPAPGAAAPPPGRKSVDIPPSARYPTPPFSPPPAMLPGSSAQHSLPSTASTRASVSSPRPQSTTSGSTAYQTMMDEFGQYLPQPNASGSGSRYRASHAPTMPLLSPEPSSMSAAVVPHHHHHHNSAAMQEPTAQQRKRQSHNPAAVVQGSPPKQEYLSDEYVLHPSVHAYKQAHPNRAMIALGHYILLQTLGEGEFGKVKLGVHSEYGVEVAIKLIRRGTLEDETRANKVEREIEVLKQIKHPNIVRMLDVIDTAKYIGIVLEFAGGGELFDYILANRFLKEKDASRLFAQLISGVDYLHKKHIVHRDLKLENLLLDRHRNIIITDFGFANRFERDQSDLMATSCGSPCYAAPELVVSEGLYVGTAVDVWSCGVILYAMLSGYLPYDDDPDNPDGDNINLLYKYIMSTPLNFPDHMSRMAMDLLLMMLVPNPTERCTIPDIEIHPWLDNYRSIFDRSVEEHERLFTENMNRKNQQARRDLAQRRRLQQEAKLAKALQRSQSTQSTTVAMLDQHHRSGKSHRHRSALPTTTTMPDYLYNAGDRERLPMLDTQPEHAPVESKSAHPSLPMPALPPLPSMIAERPAPAAPSATFVTPETPKRSKSTRPREQPDHEMAEPVTPPRRERDQPKTPHSANKNRHTIQVEYEGDMRWEEGAIETKPQDIVDPPQEPLSVPQLGDMEVDTASELESKSDARTLTPPPPETPSLADAAPILETPAVPDEKEAVAEVPAAVDAEKPPAEQAQAEESVSEASAPPPRPPRRPLSIPQTPSKRARESHDAPQTPKAPAHSESQLATPKAEQRNAALPPGAATPTQQPSSGLPQTADELPAPPRPQKRDRATRRTMGMSLDKLGLAKLLGQTQTPPTSRQSYIPVSQHNKSASVALTSSTSPAPGSQHSNTTGSSPDKKSRRKTLNLMSNGRAGTPDTSVSSRAPSAASTASKAPVVGPSGIQPRPSHDQSSPSLTTVDPFQGSSDSHGHRSTASSSAARRVMDWFRRKSAAKETLTTLKSSSVRGDSMSSAGRASMSVDRPDRGYVHITKPRNSTDVSQMLVRDESIGAANTGPSIVVSESPVSKSGDKPSPPSRRDTSTRKSIDVVRSVVDRVERRQPLAPANSKANIDDKKKHLGASDRAALPGRSKSVRTPHGMHHSLAGSSLVTPQSVAESRLRNATTAPSGDESKMRVHTGLVDQSALSSRPPAEVIAEVIGVLHGMGIDVKQEADFRLRCTRVRRRKAGPTTGLSTGGNPGSVSLKNGDARGLPSTGSGGLSGLKGMLLRRGSSYSSYNSAALARSESDLLASASNSTTPVVASPQLGPVKEPLYGEHSIDNGDEVKFVVELCRIKNLQGLYLLNIKRLRGSVWSFKFIYQTIVERSETLTH